MAKPNPKARGGFPAKKVTVAFLAFAFKVLLAVFKKRNGASNRGVARPSGGRGNTVAGPPKATRDRQKARRREQAAASTGSPATATAPRPRRGEHPITALQRTGAEGHWTEGDGVVFRNLPDDLEGSRHQRFLVRLSDGHVIKVSHNIDLAKRVPAREGDRLRFAGDFESNDLGGALHWTHLDPRNWHPHGWIEHEGKRYE